MIKGVDYIGVGITFTCHDGTGKVLFAKRGQGARDAQGVWELPGGGLKFGESPEEGMLRELREEFCVIPLAYVFAGYHDLVRTNGTVVSHWILIDFVVHVDPALVKIGEPDKCEAIAWHTLDAIPEPTHPGVYRMLPHIKQTIQSVSNL